MSRRPPALTVENPACLCVLASGSSGNCSVLLRRSERGVRGMLIDAGLSPRRTRRLLAEHGVPLSIIDDVLLTHLDSDHFHSGWMRELDSEYGELRATLRVHRNHERRLHTLGRPPRRLQLFEDAFGLTGVEVGASLLSHDQLGVAAFRFEFEGERAASLGFATDLGRPSDDLVLHLHDVDTLAIESNYCPVMQRESPRPGYLKARIMGGAGHLSNEQCAATVRRIAPRQRVVLLHLSRQCNTPELAARAHEGARYGVELTSQTEPTPWLAIESRPPGVGRAPAPVRIETLPLFGSAPQGAAP